MATRKPRGRYKKHKENPTSFVKMTAEERHDFWYNSDNLRRCCTCLEHKVESKFGKLKSGYKGLAYRCQSCANSRSKELYHRNRKDCPKHKEKVHDYYCRTAYGITLAEYNEKLQSQGFKCSICEIEIQKGKAHLDHNHTTGKLRDFLCNNCNRALGHFKENIETLNSAIRYLETHNE